MTGRFRRLFFRGSAWFSTLILVGGCQIAPIQRHPPAPWTSGDFTAPDGERFPYTSWLPDGKPHAVIIAIHGLGGAASDWKPLGAHMQRRGIAVFAHELRSMGHDPVRRRIGRLPSPRAWFDDFISFAGRIEATYPDTPIFWYGESLGGIIGTRMLHEAPAVGLRPRGFILASPIVQVEDKLPRWQEWALRLGAALLPGLRIDLQSLAPDDAPAPQVVSDTTHEDQLTRTPHAVTRFSLRLLEEIRRLVGHNQRRAPKTTLPVLLLYGGRDVFTAPEEVERFFHRLGSPDKTQRFYPRGYHLLLHDVDRASVLSEIDRWIDRLLRQPASHETALSGK